MRILDEAAYTAEKELHEIAEYLDGILASWKRWDVIISDVRGGQMLGPQVKFPPKC
jgi:hypothetical protein